MIIRKSLKGTYRTKLMLPKEKPGVKPGPRDVRRPAQGHPAR